jgi:ABC-2 type transport system ATP-binding protein
MSYTVQATGICKTFAHRQVLDHVDLAIDQGSVLGLLGPNGAGKTTLVRILATLLRPDAGVAIVAGHDLLADPVGVKRSISLTGQYAAVDDVLTGRENLEMMARLLRVPRRSMASRVAELLAAFDLAAAADRRAGTYSGGMRRRLDLAISMIARPTLLFLDEPTTGLDPRSREQVWGTVRDLAAEGVTILLTTQYLEEADQLADTIAMLDRGRIVAEGTADELKAKLGGEVLRLQFSGPAALRMATSLLDATEVDDRLYTLELATDGSAADVRSVLGGLDTAGVPVLKVSTHRPSLDDVFLALTEKETVS